MFDWLQFVCIIQCVCMYGDVVMVFGIVYQVDFVIGIVLVDFFIVVVSDKIKVFWFVFDEGKFVVWDQYGYGKGVIVLGLVIGVVIVIQCCWFVCYGVMYVVVLVFIFLGKVYCWYGLF